MKKQDSPPSITPQRKHRKLLKDGSGTEVWPESIEKIFVQGLREYWESPYATYSQSRGRSRWRNQFLVDYLNKQGIERTKKQVASHIQVLRNMWKGEPEFHLVAGGDELYPENDSPVAPPPVKLEDHYESNSLLAFDWDENDLPSSNSVSPNFSPADSQSEFPPTPEHRPNLYPSDFGAIKLQTLPDLGYPSNSPSISPHGDYIQALPPYHDATPFGVPFGQAAKYSSANAHSINNVPATPFNVAHSRSRSAAQDSNIAQQSQAVNRHMSATPTHYRYSRNRVTSMHLQADGMTPFSVKVDALASPAQPVQPPFTLRMRLYMPTVHDVRAPPSLSGFLAGVSMENVWSVSAKCVTKVYGNNVCIGEESGLLTVQNINVGTVNAALPDSSLSRCRWFDIGYQTLIITQEIVVDDETLLFLIYDLDRKNGGPMPSAALLGFQKYTRVDKGNASSGHHSTPSGHHAHPGTTLSPSPGAPPVSPHAGPYARAASMQPSLNPYAMASPTTTSMRRQY